MPAPTLPRLIRFLPGLAVAVALLPPCVTGAESGKPAAVTSEAAQFFETRIRPLLVESCFRCHGEGKKKGGLRLDSRAALLAGGDRGPAVVPGSPEKSLLVKAISHEDELRMPPARKLPKARIDDLTRWVRMGAPWPGASNTTSPPRPATFEITEKDRSHWAFQPVRRPKIPALADRTRPVQPIDAFILSALEAKGLRPSPPAGKRELIRRAYFDLIGLPPTPEEIDAFVSSKVPDAYEKLLDQLLARPQYGERWGRHFLDVVRFAQTNGYERDDEKPNSWRYRDYVIQSFNADKPYDRFVMEQIAGDELEGAGDEGLIATGFYRLGVWDDEPDDARQAEFDHLDDMLSTAGEAFLGLTLGCARCHDHKFDPIGQEDYYSTLAFLRNITPAGPRQLGTAVMLRTLKSGEVALAIQETGTQPPPTHVLLRGNVATPGKEVGPRFPRVLCRPGKETPRLVPPASGQKSCGRRRALAEWLVRRDNPLTARVIVNRLWQHHFGRALVPTPNDFGRNGAQPSHPALLDYLASELVEGGWRLKRLHRLIMLSDAYRQSSSIASDRALSLDPDNALLWRQNLRRLEAEAIRDAVLAVSGRLNLKMGGRGIFPDLPPEVLSTQSRPGSGWGKSDPAERDRRSVYIFVKRTLGVPLLDTFDFASPDKSIATRTTTTIAPQALILLNSTFMEEQAQAFAERMRQECGTDAGRAVERAFRLALGRLPTERERGIALDFLRRAGREDGDGKQGLARLCKLVLNLNEFVYVD